MTTHRFRGLLREVVVYNGTQYAVTSRGVLKFVGRRWRDAVITEADLRRLIKNKEK